MQHKHRISSMISHSGVHPPSSLSPTKASPTRFRKMHFVQLLDGFSTSWDPSYRFSIRTMLGYPRVHRWSFALICHNPSFPDTSCLAIKAVVPTVLWASVILRSIYSNWTLCTLPIAWNPISPIVYAFPNNSISTRGALVSYKRAFQMMLVHWNCFTMRTFHAGWSCSSQIWLMVHSQHWLEVKHRILRTDWPWFMQISVNFVSLSMTRRSLTTRSSSSGMWVVILKGNTSTITTNPPTCVATIWFKTFSARRMERKSPSPLQITAITTLWCLSTWIWIGPQTIQDWEEICPSTINLPTWQTPPWGDLAKMVPRSKSTFSAWTSTCTPWAKMKVSKPKLYELIPT